MDPILFSICLASHALATVILVGQYLLSSLVIIPTLEKLASEKERARLLPALLAKARPWILTSLAVFIVTGTLMMMTDGEYLGFMNFGNAWSILMIVKHVLAVAWVFLGISLDMNVARHLSEAGDADRPARLAQFRRMNSWAAWGGVGILIITAILQAM
jgi:uncharacterized membrane protein